MIQGISCAPTTRQALGLANIICCLISQPLYFPPFFLFSFSYKCKFWASETSSNLLRDIWPVSEQPGSHYAKWLVISLREPCCPEFAYVVHSAKKCLFLWPFSYHPSKCLHEVSPGHLALQALDLVWTCPSLIPGLWLSLQLHCEPLMGKNCVQFILRIPAPWTCLTAVCWPAPPDG